MGEVYCSQSMGIGWPESQIGYKEKLWLIMKKKWAESCRTSVLLQKAARPYIQESHGAEIPPWMEISTVGHWLQPCTGRPRFAFTPSCNIRHFICCRHDSSLVCETLPTLRVLTWRSHQVRGCWHKGDFPAIGWEGSYWYSPPSIWTYSRCMVFFKDPHLLQLEFSGCSMKWKCSSTEKKIDSQSSQSAFPGG